MIDLHNHIIYNVDDGSRSLEESMRMILAARDAGFTTICFTPHYMEDGYKTSKDELINKFNNIKNEVSLKAKNMQLFLGEEVMIFPTMDEKLDDYLCINATSYLLFELPLVEDVNYLTDTVYNLQANNKTLILAHPERYDRSSEDYGFLKDLAKTGVLFQININSLNGQYGTEAKKVAIKLLHDDLVSFVATDSHRARDYRNSVKAYKKLRRLVSEEKFLELTELAPLNVLKDVEHDNWEFLNDKNRKNKFLLNLLYKLPFLIKWF